MLQFQFMKSPVILSQRESSELCLCRLRSPSAASGCDVRLIDTANLLIFFRLSPLVSFDTCWVLSSAFVCASHHYLHCQPRIAAATQFLLVTSPTACFFLLSISFCPSQTDQAVPSCVICFTSDLSLTDPDNRSELLFDFKWRAVEQGYLLAVPPL